MTILGSDSLAQMLAMAGVAREVGGNTPFLLRGPSTAWLVQTGSVEVFAVRVEDGEGQGMRHHFLSGTAGDLLLGMDLDASEGLGLLAVAAVGTVVVELPLAKVRALVEEPSLAYAAVDLVDRWVAAVSAGVSQYIYPKPRADVVVDPGTAPSLKAGQRLRSRKGVTWVRHRQGGSLFIGMEPLDPGDPPPRTPLTHETWIEAIGAAELEVSGTADALADGSLWAALASFYGLVFRCQSYNTTLAAVDEYNRLAKKTERERQVREDSLEELASIIARTSGPRRAETQHDDPLLLACAAVGDAMGVQIEPPPKASSENRAADPLLEIAKASRVRTRQVVLEGQWWTLDHGPLLGYRADGLAPIALLPVSPSRYVLVDPSARTTTPVTPDVAATVSTTAIMFYAPFADDVVTGAALLRFGLRKSRPDLWRVAAMAAAAGVLGLITPLAVGRIFDTVVPEAERGQLLQIGLVLLVCAVAGALFQVTQALALLRIEGRLDSSINAAIMDRLLALPTSFFRQFSSGDLGMRTYGLSQMRQMLSGAVVATVFTAIASVFSVGLLFYYDWRLALVAMVVIGALLLATAVVARAQLARQRRLLGIQGRLWGFVLEILTGIAKLRVSGAEGHAFAGWARTFGEQKRLTYEGRSSLNLLLAFHSALP
ncbi:MAG: ABC transporter transmembrane domain-containing protein, partial [Vicinamibacterales bacterium]